MDIREVPAKPDTLILPDLKWRYLVRSVARGKNILLTGPSGCGKTLCVQTVAEVLPTHKYFYFNLGATQDPRSTLVGNTHFSKDSGTFVANSFFVNSIQVPNAIILLDEISRAHPDAWNILMTVLDVNQKYLRIDEHPDTPTIRVADGVCFMATANIGSEYTSTRVMDRALMDRFVNQVEMEPLSFADELKLLQLTYGDVPGLVAIASIADFTRCEVRKESARVSTIISTRVTKEMAELLVDGFTLEEIADVCIYPFYSDHGGSDSPRTFMKQIVQKQLTTTARATL